MKKTILLSLALLAAYPVFAAPEKLAPIPHLHPSVIQGQLPNGLRYLIKPIAPQAGQPSEVELRLLVNSGSLSEAGDERGIAHLIEHMAFRQTKNFGKDEVKAFFNSNGLRWTNDSNAFTSMESTMYFFKVKPDNLDRGLQLMADWANGDIVFDAEELMTERGVVLDEIRLRKEDQQRWGGYLSVLIPNAPHLDNLPTGFEENVRDLPQERIEALYRKLYQPQKMTLVVAGNVPKLTEQKIEAPFAKAPIGDQASQYNVLPLTPKVRIYRGNPPPWPQNEFGVSWNFIQQPATDAKQVQLQSIAMQAMQQRLQKLAMQGDQHFSSAEWVDPSGMVGKERYLTLYTVIKHETLGDGLTQLYREIRRARETGFSDTEIADAIAAYAQALRKMPESNEVWADSLLHSAKFGIPALFVAEQNAIFDTTEITPQAVNAVWQSILSTPDQVAMLMRPKESRNRTDIETWTDEKLVAMMASVDAETLQAPVAHVEKPLLAKEPKRGKVVKTKTENGATLWTLSNGAQVLLRQQRQANEQIGVNVYFAGGALALPKEVQSASKVLPNYMSLAGLGDLNAAEVNYALRNEVLEFKPIFETDRHGFGGFSEARSLPAMMQLLYLSIALPRSDDAANEKAALQAYQGYVQSGPGVNLNLYGEAWPYRSWFILNDFELSTEKLDQLRVQLYGNPAQLRMVLTGIADMAQAKDLVERYVASIPVPQSDVVTLSPKKIEPKVQPLSSTVLSERLKESLNTYSFFDNKYMVWSVALDGSGANTQNAFMQEGLNDLIKQRLYTRLREQAGGTYEVHTWGEMSAYFGSTLTFAYSISREKCGESLVMAAQELRKLSQNSVTDAELKAMHELMQKGLDNGPKYPFWYAYSQMFHWVNNQDMSWINPKPAQVLSRANVDAAAKSWFVPEKWIVAADACKTLPDLTVLDQTVTAVSK